MGGRSLCYNAPAQHTRATVYEVSMARMVSLIVLVVCILVIGALFVAVMAQFLIPMFLAAILVVLFRPLHQWLLRRCRGRHHVAAALTTLIIVLSVLIPLLLLVTRAANDAVTIASNIDQRKLDQLEKERQELVDKLRLKLDRFGIQIPDDEHLQVKEVWRYASGRLQIFIAPAAVRTTQFVGNLLLGLFIMLVSLYFFLADGPDMIKGAMRLSPLDDRYEAQLLDEFVRVSRAVVMATLLSALAQGVLAGVGYAVVGLDSVFLLTVLTMLLALVPFVGATAVWGSCALWLFFMDGRPVAALLLAIWGAAVVSLVDNFIKPYVLHGQSNLHPLLALLSVLGGIKTLGPIGILIGPMAVAFLQALLNILRTELDAMETKSAPVPPA